MAHLGYPAYFCVILGVWKVLGASAVLARRFPRLKEWAYAGTVFDLTEPGGSLLDDQGGSFLNDQYHPKRQRVNFPVSPHWRFVSRQKCRDPTGASPSASE